MTIYNHETINLAGNKKNEYNLAEKREVNITTDADGTNRICVSTTATEAGISDKSWCEKFINVANDTYYEIRTNAEMGAGTNALKKISIFARIEAGYTYDNYLDVFFIIFSGTSEVGRTSQASGWVLHYETDKYFAGNLNFKAYNLPSTGMVDVAVVWRNKI